MNFFCEIDFSHCLHLFSDIAMDWSDHAMWWPEKNIWLDNTRWTLDQYNITADAFLQFTPMHKTLRIQLPDLRYIDCSVDFSVKTFNALLNLCSELEIRHPEELSLCKPLELEHLKYNYSQVKRAEDKRRRVTLGAMPNRTTSASTQDLDRMIVVDRPDTNTFIANRYVCRDFRKGSSINQVDDFFWVFLTPFIFVVTVTK